MSKNVVDSVIKFCNDTGVNMGLIPSRRQIEYEGGYVNNWTTEEFVNYVKERTNKVILQRDHGGRSQGNLSHSASFYVDAKCGFDLIHVDPWKEFVNLDEVVEETVENINYCFSANPNCCYEVGTEEAIHKYTHEELDYFLAKTKERLGAGKWENVVYAVIQAGSRLMGTENVGTFDETRCRDMIDVCKKHKLLSKEHNGDYLTNEQIKRRFDIGLDAINIAPEFGVDETKIILNALDDDMADKFYQLCLSSGRWVKWFPANFKPCEENKKQLMLACGHYMFANPEFCEIKKNIEEADKNIKNHFDGKLANLMKTACGKKSE